MLRLSARFAGAHPYFTTPEHTAVARPILGPEPLLIPEQAVSLDPPAAAGVRTYAARYLRMPNYTQMLKNFGFTDEDIADGGSDQLVNTIIPSGAAAGVGGPRAPRRGRGPRGRAAARRDRRVRHRPARELADTVGGLLGDRGQARDAGCTCPAARPG